LGAFLLSSSPLTEKAVENSTKKVVRHPVAFLVVRGLSFSVILIHYDADKRELVFERESRIWGYRFQLERALDGSVRSVPLFRSDNGGNKT
jgi:hypothetical protein